MDRIVVPANASGSATAPASKSSMQRAVACALLAEGESLLRGPSRCADSLAALAIARAFGASVEDLGDRIRVVGAPEALLSSPAARELPCGESGLCIRMFAPIAALGPARSELVASGSLRKRSVEMAAGPLEALGARCATSDGLPPLVVRGPLRGGRAVVEAGASSQFLTGLLLALPLAPGDSELEVRGLASGGYVDLTLATMRAFGVGVEAGGDARDPVFRIAGGRRYRAADFRVEGDWSGAAFLLVAGAVAGGTVIVEGLDPASAQPDRAALDALRDSGALVEVSPGAVAVSRGALRAFRFDARDRPDLFPPLAVLAAYCPGTSELVGVSRLRGKESDRAAALRDGLGGLGIRVRVEGDSLLIEGGRPGAGEVDSRGDHRIAMAAAVAALGALGPVLVRGAECVSKSWPTFFEDLGRLTSSS